jgi:hypothetical protein
MTTDRRVKLMCYCCGEQLSGRFALVTMSHEPADRVFVMKLEHMNRTDSARYLEVTLNDETRDEDQDLPPPVPRRRS